MKTCSLVSLYLKVNSTITQQHNNYISTIESFLAPRISEFTALLKETSISAATIFSVSNEPVINLSTAPSSNSSVSD